MDRSSAGEKSSISRVDNFSSRSGVKGSIAFGVASAFVAMDDRIDDWALKASLAAPSIALVFWDLTIL